MNALAITSITNFILAGEVLFLAGMLVQRPKTRFSAWRLSSEELTTASSKGQSYPAISFNALIGLFSGQ